METKGGNGVPCAQRVEIARPPGRHHHARARDIRIPPSNFLLFRARPQGALAAAAHSRPQWACTCICVLCRGGLPVRAAQLCAVS